MEEFKALLKSDEWPAAVSPYLICDGTLEEDKQDRAEGILNLLVPSLEGMRFLDFGCGEGHVVSRALEQSLACSVGYDIQEFDRWKEWPQNEKMLLTTSWEEVEKKKPYDIVLIYDVLDHMQGTEEELIAKLKEIKSLLSPEGKVYVRCHPWCSRHGTHLFHQINKAYIHLVFEEDELEEMGYKGLPTRKIIHPITTYEYWFKEAGFKSSFIINSRQVDAFFINRKKIAATIKTRWKESPDKTLNSGKHMPLKQMGQEFLDYILQC